MELVALGTTAALAAGTTVVIASKRCARTADSGATARAVALAAGLLFAIGALAALALAALLRARTCDEVCGTTSGWLYDRHAWQWRAQLALAAVATLGTCSLPALLANRSYRVVSRFAVATTIAWLLWGWVFLAQIDQT